jgi:hypothetical protein
MPRDAIIFGCMSTSSYIQRVGNDPPNSDAHAVAPLVWLTDPGDSCSQIEASEPVLDAGGLSFDVRAPAIHPADGLDQAVLLDALSRTLAAWCSVAPGILGWHSAHGSGLAVFPAETEELNAYYDRHRGLLFGVAKSPIGRIWTANSADMVAHEVGHAVLDGLRPDLFDVAGEEAAAMHEAFADISVFVSAVVGEIRVAEHVVEVSAGFVGASTAASRVAEQLGDAYRRNRPALVEADCLRNLANRFAYQDFRTLPAMAPAYLLSQSPHSFGRIFSGAFLSMVEGLFHAVDGRTGEDLQAVVVKSARLLVGALADARIRDQLFAEVAITMIRKAFASPDFSTDERDAVVRAIVDRAILSVDSAGHAAAAPQSARTRAAAIGSRPQPSRVVTVSVPGDALGLGGFSIAMEVPAAEPAARAGGIDGQARRGSAGDIDRARAFLLNAIRRGVVDAPEMPPMMRALRRKGLPTHVLVREGQSYILRRERFDGGQNG